MGPAKGNAWIERFKQVMSPHTINELGHAVGWCQRERRITPWRLALSLLAGFSTQRLESLADAQRLFNALFGTDLTYKPFHKQLAKARFADFMRALAGQLLDRLRVQVLEAQPGGAFAEFDRIVIQDGSSFKLKDALADTFPGRFKSQGPAAVELHTTLELFDGAPSQVGLTPDTDPERAHLPAPDALTDSLLLADRGYFERAYLAALDDAGAHFVVRAYTSINPHVVAAFNDQGQPRLAGKALKATRLPKPGVADLDVRHGAQTWSVRLIVSWNPRSRRYLLLLTNLARSRYAAAQVKQAYQLRWQVELLFKEYKSYANLHAFDTANPAIAEGLIWAAVAAATLKRFVAHTTQRVHAVAISSRKVAMCAPPVLFDLFKALVSNRIRRIRHAFNATLTYLAANAQRAHPRRERRSGRLQLDLEPIANCA